MNIVLFDFDYWYIIVSSTLMFELVMMELVLMTSYTVLIILFVLSLILEF